MHAEQGRRLSTISGIRSTQSWQTTTERLRGFAPRRRNTDTKLRMLGRFRLTRGVCMTSTATSLNGAETGTGTIRRGIKLIRRAKLAARLAFCEGATGARVRMGVAPRHGASTLPQTV